MKDTNGSRRIGIDLNEIDFAKLGRVGEKVRSLMIRKINNPIGIYLLLKWLCFSVEENFEFRLEPEEEDRLRKMFIEE